MSELISRGLLNLSKARQDRLDAMQAGISAGAPQYGHINLEARPKSLQKWRNNQDVQ